MGERRTMQLSLWTLLCKCARTERLSRYEGAKSTTFFCVPRFHSGFPFISFRAPRAQTFFFFLLLFCVYKKGKGKSCELERKRDGEETEIKHGKRRNGIK
uniref:Uncharacterized protein n=1 Tax=Trypanosoma vivax (strain Y486) TaxID=1055687 RepID=G0TZ51_TRYVY|nr:hypothetical protein, unlikely [Trypanosoma vivax Y486]